MPEGLKGFGELRLDPFGTEPLEELPDDPGNGCNHNGADACNSGCSQESIHHSFSSSGSSGSSPCTAPWILRLSSSPKTPLRFSETEPNSLRMWCSLST